MSPAALSLSPQTADFGTVTVNSTSGAITFTVTNTGEAESGSVSAIVSGANASDFTVQNGCSTLAGSGTCVVSVTFHPTAAGPKAGNLVVTGSPGGTVMATLNAAAVNPTALSITGSPFDFGSLVTGTTSATGHVYTVTNNGGVTSGMLTVTPAGANPTQFMKTADTCNGQTLAAGASCSFTVSFAPTSTGTKNASFDVSANPGGTVSGTATGMGISNATIVVTPNAADFGSVTSGSNSTQVSFVVTNSGGVATGALAAPTITGAQAGEFNIVSQNCTGAVLQPGSANSCTVIARFSPTTQGSAAGTLNVTGTPGGTGTANLSGTGNAVGSLTFNPTTFDFQTVNVGSASAPQQFTLSNPGGSSIGPLTLATGGTDANQFQIVAGTDTCTGQTLLPLVGTCTVSVTFNPTSAGGKSGTLSATAPTGTFTAALSGTGITGASLSIAPSSHDYGSIAIMTNSAFQDFIITNNGGVASGVPSVSLNGPNASEFNIANPPSGGCTAALAPGASCTISVRFSPVIVSSIAKSATLDVTASPGGNVSATLSGFAISQAQIRSNPPSLNFNVVTIGDSSATQTITVTNNGAATTSAISVQITGADAADYSQTNDCTTLVNAATCTVTVTFSPKGPFVADTGTNPDRTDTRNASVVISATTGGTTTTSLTGQTVPRLQIIFPADANGNNENPYDFGAVDVMDFPAGNQCVDIEIRNNTSSDQTVTQTLNSGSPAEFFLNGFGFCGNGTSTCAGTLAAGDTCDMVVRFNPESTGVKTGSVVYSIGAGADNTATQQLTGTGGSLSINPCTSSPCTGIAPAVTPANPFDYGTVNVGSTKDWDFWVDNDTGVATGPIFTKLTGASFHIIDDQCAGNSVNTFGGCHILVEFVPTATGTATGTITITDSTGAQIMGSQNLTGTGGTATTIAVSPATANFTAFSGEAATQTITVSNSNGGTSGPVVFSTPGSPFFTILQGNPGDCMNGSTTLASGQSCTIRVRYAPTGTCVGTDCTTGDNQSSISVQANPGGTFAVKLNGTEKSTISITPATQSYSTTDDGTVVTHGYIVSNNSASTVMVTAVSPNNINIGTFSVTGNTCGNPLAPAATCTFNLQYTNTNQPGDLGATANVTVSANTGGQASGTAVSTLTAHVQTKAALTLSPNADREFGTVLAPGGSSSSTWVVTNIGEQTSGIPLVTVTGDPVSFMLSQNGCTAPLAQNATCSVTVTFAPLTPGPKSGTLNLNNGTPASVMLTGTGLSNTAVTITPAQNNYPTTAVGSMTAPVTFTVNNPTGTAVTLNTGAAVLNNPNFTIDPASTCATMLNGGASCTYIVRFTPATAGAHDNVQLTPIAGTYASLSGIGIDNTNVMLDPIAFGNVEIAPATGATVTETITNMGFGNTGTLNLAVAGTNAAMFSISPTSTCQGLDLASGASCTVVVTFSPTTTGAKVAQVNLTAPSTGFAGTIALTGSGQNHPTISAARNTSFDAVAQGNRAVGDEDNSLTIYTITNDAASAPTGNLQFSLDDNNNFSISTAGIVTNPCNLTAPNPLGSGASCNVGILYSPTELGAKSVTLVVQDATQAADRASVSNAVSGTGTQTLTAPASVSFGSTTMVVQKAITFTNNSDLTMGNFVVDTSGLGPQVSIVNDSCSGQTVNALATCTVTVRLVPNGTGFTSATLKVSGSIAGTLDGTSPPGGYPRDFTFTSDATVNLTP